MSEKPSSYSPDILTASGHVGYSWDLINDRIIWYGAWEEIFGEKCPTPPNNSAEFSSLVLANDHHLIFNNTESSFNRTYRLLDTDGALISVDEHGTTQFEKNHAVQQQGILHLTTKTTRQNTPHFISPDRDALTGRPSRTCFLSLIEKVMNSAPDVMNLSAYMIVSVDKLAFLNEAMGSKTADLFLCAVADRLGELCPTRAIIGRVGSDLFGILMPGMADSVDALADRILQNFHSHAITSESLTLHVAISIGSLSFKNRRTDAQSFMIFAEQALAEAREKGGGHHIPYIESPERSYHNRFILETGELVKEALKNDTIHLAFQPVFDAQTNDIAFYEVLSRLYNKKGELVSPADFIPIVEQLGLAPDYDRHILNKSLAELDACDTLRLAVNISGLTAALPDWPDYVHRQLVKRPQVAERLIIEITENAAVLDIAKIKCLVDTLRKMGSQVALDDFGAGSTSIRHLRDLSLAIMKIDRDLLINLLENPDQQHLVRMLTSMAHGLGLRAVAEGIETEEVATWLRRENVDMLQGFHLGRPSFDRPWLEK